MATIKEKIDRRLNDTFTENLRIFLKEKFPDIEFETTISLSSMRLVTTWNTKNKKICTEIKKYIEAYERAYTDARKEVWRVK